MIWKPDGGHTQWGFDELWGTDQNYFVNSSSLRLHWAGHWLHDLNTHRRQAWWNIMEEWGFQVHFYLFRCSALAHIVVGVLIHYTIYHISTYGFRGNYSLLEVENQEIFIYRISSYNCRGNYSSSEETIQVFISLV